MSLPSREIRVNSAVVSLSDIVREGRMDAPFHIALATLKDRVEALRARHTADQAVAMIDAMPLHALHGMSVLSRGTMPKGLNRALAHDLAVEYPHLALAIVQAGVESSITRIRSQIAQDEHALALLLALAPSEEETR